MNKMFDLTCQWADWNESKECYAFAEEPFPKENFMLLVKETMLEIMEYRKKALNLDNHVAELKKAMWDFNLLLIEIAKYSVKMSIDESEDYIFSASQAITRLILDNVTFRCRVTPLDNTGVLCGTCEECGFYCPDDEDLDSEVWSQSFKYDPNKGDMSPFIELVKRSLG